MRKLIILIAALVTGIAWASQRVIVIEDFTATWCQYCPGCARGTEELDFRAFDSVVCIAYHSSSSGDPFYNAAAAARASYYGLRGYPTLRVDGLADSVVGGMNTGTMYPTYRQIFDRRKLVSSPLEISAFSTYDSVSRAGQLSVTIRNTSGASVSGTLQCVVVENHIYYPWQGMDSLQFVERAMLPSASGEVVTIPAGDSLVKTRDFTLATGIVAANCQIVVFVQNATKQILQGTRTGLIMKPRLAYCGYQPVFPQPNETANLTVALRNIGTGVGQGVAATLSTNDPYVTVTSASTTFPDIAVAQTAYANAPFQIRVADGCPSPHLAMMDLEITASNGYVLRTSFPMNITLNPGYTDSMETGTNGWVHNGIRDNWHQTNHRSSSPTHSWYCGLENSWVYSAENDARLMTPYFTVPQAGRMTFRHFYATEAAYDFCLVEIDNGSGFWAPLASYDGNAGWSLAEFDLSNWSGKTVQVRFRFVSDNSINYEGWYVDDFCVTPLTGVVESKPSDVISFGQIPGLLTGPVNIKCLIPSGEQGTLAIYDIRGRLVRSLGVKLVGTDGVTWDLRDYHGQLVCPGTYFLRLAAGVHVTAAKLVVLQ